MRPITDEHLQELLNLCEPGIVKKAIQEKRYADAAQSIYNQLWNLAWNVSEQKNSFTPAQRKEVLNAFGLCELKSEELLELFKAYKYSPEITLINKLVLDGMHSFALELVELHQHVSPNDSENYFAAFKTCVSQLNTLYENYNDSGDNHMFNVIVQMAEHLLSTKNVNAEWYSIFKGCSYSFLHIISRI